MNSSPNIQSSSSFTRRIVIATLAMSCGVLQTGCGASDERPSTDPPAALGAQASTLTAAPVFPLKLSANQRYLVDQTGAPFLINQASSWALIQALPTNDARDYLDILKQKGFNSVMVSVISNDVRMAGGPPNWQGVPPFTTQWDYSSANPAYFAHADEIINLAKDRGMLVTLVPSYLGYPSEPTQGWADEMLSNNNSVAKSLAYGRFLGSRYKNFSNIIWIAGGDNQPAAGSELENRLKAIVNGIKEQAPAQLWTGHWDSVAHGSGVFATENPTFASIMDIDGYYAYDYDFTYVRDWQFYSHSPAKMTFHLDQSYESETGGTPENIRRKAYQAVLTGAAGSSFCAAPNWSFQSWRTNMDTTGTRETEIWYKLFTSRAWQDLVPDRDHLTVTSGYGTWGDYNYVAAARTSTGGTVIAYPPRGGAFTVNMTRVSGSQANAWWYDPTSGQSSLIGTFSTSGSRTFTVPNGNSWVFVLDDASLNLGQPGSGTAPPPATNNAPTVATAPTAAQNPVTTASTSFSILGADDGGESNLSYRWATTGTPPATVAFSPNGSNAAKSTVATFGKAGAYSLQATISDAQGLSITSALNVNVSSTLTTIVASPANVTVAPSSTSQFSATATDQFGLNTVPQPTFAWSVSGGGSINGSGLFTAGTSSGGPFTISASASGKVGKASVTVGTASAFSARINAGSGAVSPFSADQFGSGGYQFSSSATVTTAGVANAAPAAVYQSERYGNFNYTFTGMAAGSAHTVRLHFAEIYWTTPGNRLFNVAVNGGSALSNFDIFAAAGGANIAVVRDITAAADSSGKLTITFTTVRDNAKVSAIEIL
jgi:hypothetical protein